MVLVIKLHLVDPRDPGRTGQAPGPPTAVASRDTLVEQSHKKWIRFPNQRRRTLLLIMQTSDMKKGKASLAHMDNMSGFEASARAAG